MKLKKAVLWLLAISLFIILFGISFGFEKMKGQTMEKYLRNDQTLIILKFRFGIRLPFSEKTLFQTSLPAHHEVVAFNNPLLQDVPVNQKPIRISRCIGLPGDTLQIREKEVLINRKQPNDPETVQRKYRMFIAGHENQKILMEKYNISQGGKINDVGLYDFPLTKKQASEIQNDSLVSGFRLLKSKEEAVKSQIFPTDPYYAFTIDNYGPVVVPQKGWTVPVNIRNIGLYKRIIHQYEGNNLTTTYDKVYINGEEAFSYTFKENYIFVLDDNRDYGDDSRNWGFLPTDHLIGKVTGL